MNFVIHVHESRYYGRESNACAISVSIFDETGQVDRREYTAHRSSDGFIFLYVSRPSGMAGERVFESSRGTLGVCMLVALVNALEPYSSGLSAREKMYPTGLVSGVHVSNDDIVYRLNSWDCQ